MAEADLDIVIRSLAKKQIKTLTDAARKRHGRLMAMAAKAKDKDAKAPYLFNPTTLQFITFDDEWSVKNKCEYVIKNNLAGVMFWEYSSDKKEYLLKEIDKDLKH